MCAHFLRQNAVDNKADALYPDAFELGLGALCFVERSALRLEHEYKIGPGRVAQKTRRLVIFLFVLLN